MKIKKSLFSFLFGIVTMTFLYSCSGKKEPSLRVAVASNAQFVADSLVTIFEKEHAVDIELIVTSSGKLTAQIIHAAPYDIFLSADMKYPRSIFEAGAALTEPNVYASGKLVLWTTQDIDLDKGLSSLKTSAIKNIAVANPKTAPYGVAAISALKKSGLYEHVSGKIVYGESISQVNQYQLTGATNVAFTAMSVVKSPKLRGKGKFITIDDTLYRPIKQGAIILKHAEEKNLKMARKFYQLIFSERGKEVFRYFGYRVS